ncbi:MAG: hypothetical protein R3A10_18875 [Caldilineaceae bacterium]
MALDPLAGKPAPLDLLENIPDLIAHYYEVQTRPQRASRTGELRHVRPAGDIH